MDRAYLSIAAANVQQTMFAHLMLSKMLQRSLMSKALSWIGLAFAGMQITAVALMVGKHCSSRGHAGKPSTMKLVSRT